MKQTAFKIGEHIEYLDGQIFTASIIDETSHGLFVIKRIVDNKLVLISKTDYTIKREMKIQEAELTEEQIKERKIKNH